MREDIIIEVPAETDWDAFYAAISLGFNEDGDSERSALERAVAELRRSLVARRDGEVVGTAGIFSRRLAVPGAEVPTAHVTMISVAPSARRRGILGRFIRQQFTDALAAGEPIAALWASEGRIYQRFGYGLAVRRLSFDAESREITLPRPTNEGSLREGSVEHLRESVIKIYDEIYAARPGWSHRDAQHWDYRLADPPAWRHGASALRVTVHESDAGVDGYALWRVKEGWNDKGPSGEVHLIEHAAATVDAYLALWRYLLSMDLTRSVYAWSCALDEPILYLADEPRRLGARLKDGLWVRILDLPAALTARRYASEVDTVIEVTDELLPANSGRWRLSGGPDGASCESTVDEPDISCDINALGAAYLGGVPLSTLAAGGRVRESRPGAIAAASTAFGWHVTPSVTEVF